MEDLNVIQENIGIHQRALEQLEEEYQGKKKGEIYRNKHFHILRRIQVELTKLQNKGRCQELYEIGATVIQKDKLTEVTNPNEWTKALYYVGNVSNEQEARDLFHLDIQEHFEYNIIYVKHIIPRELRIFL